MMAQPAADETQAPLQAALAACRSEAAAAGEAITSEGLLAAFLQAIAARDVELYAAQEEAMLALAAGHHVILATPTGSGKSLVAEFLHFLSIGHGRRSWYTCPIKALVHEKFFALCRAFGPQDVGLLTGDASINRDAPIICATAEVLANVCLWPGADALAHDIVMDEFHYYGDAARGTAWQLPLLLLPESQTLLMSATLGDTTALEGHLAAHSRREVSLVQSAVRPVPLDFSYSEVPLQEQLLALLASGKAPIYVVFFSQREALDAAQATTSVELMSKADKAALKAAVANVAFDSPFGAVMRRLLLHGIGLHHAGLLPKYRLLTEQLAQQGLLRVIMGTDTLGVGINVPIRTIVLSKLCKYDGSKVGILPVREFRQITGRAGRKGYDAAGSVVAQAPEHVIENRRLESRALGDAKKLRKLVRKKPPAHNFVPWDQTTFARLQTQPAETIRSQFRLTYHLLCTLLRAHDNGYRTLQSILRLAHESPAKKRLLRREARRMVRVLLAANVCERRKVEGCSPTLALHPGLGDDFSLTHGLALFVVEALTLLDEAAESYALDVLSLVESILESPATILRQEVARKKDEANKRLKAEGKSFEERIAELDAIEHDKPLAELLYPAFNEWLGQNPWAADATLRPKSIARRLIEEGMGFAAFVKSSGLERSEGVLLRYTMQANQALAACVPSFRDQPALLEVSAYLRHIVARTDGSLLQAWETMGDAPLPTVRPGTAASKALTAAAAWQAEPKAIAARLRAALQLVVVALTARDYAAAATSFLWPADKNAVEMPLSVDEAATAPHTPCPSLEPIAAPAAEATGNSTADNQRLQSGVDLLAAATEAVCIDNGPLLNTPLYKQAKLMRIEPQDDGSLLCLQSLVFVDSEAGATLVAHVDSSVDWLSDGPVLRFVSLKERRV